MKRRVKNILFIIPILLLGFPFFFESDVFNDVKVKPLDGAFKKLDSLEFSSENWYNKKWQTNREELQKKNIKIRPSIIRLKHEMDYRVFRETHMADLIVGKEDYFFSNGWAKSRSKITTVKPELMKSHVKKLGELHDLLRQKGKHCRIFLPPSKEEIFAEYLPEKYAEENPKNDYNNYINALKENNIPHWDLLDYYKSIMDTAKYPIYSKTSVHWTKYGASYTLFNLLKDVRENLNINAPRLKVRVPYTEKAKIKAGDADFEKTLNLMSRIDTSDFLYFHYKVDRRGAENAYKPKVITIGDSYYWGVKGSWMLHHFFQEESMFLYYYNTVFFNKNVPIVNIKKLDIVEEFKSADVIFFINSPHNLLNFPFGFDKDIDKIMAGLRELPDKPLGEVKNKFAPPSGTPFNPE